MKMDIEGTIDQLCSNLLLMIQDMDSGNYSPRPIPIDRLKNWTRESYQEIFRDRAMIIIRKLKQNEHLSEDEARLIEEWMVGDIELYRNMEVHYEEWKAEVRDLIVKLQQCDHPSVNSDAKCLLNIQAVIIELDHVLRDIDHYRNALDRIRRFRSFVGQDINSLPNVDKASLADNMRTMVYSDMS